MTLSQILVSRLWWGPPRRSFEAIARRTVRNRNRILFGPIKGLPFTGGLSQILGVYEIDVQETILGYLNDGDVFYDVGANNGYFSLLGAKRVGGKGYVYAFEPYPRNAGEIRKAMSDNHVSNYTLLPEAVSNASGMAKLYVSDGGNTSTPSLMQRQGNQVLDVRTTTLDEFVRGHHWPRLIKLDVEGAEALILQGASNILSSDIPPTWIIEIHSIENDVSIRKVLKSLGYHVRVLMDPRTKRKPYPHHLLAWRCGPE